MTKTIIAGIGFIFGSVLGSMYAQQKFMLECDLNKNIVIRSMMYDCSKKQLKNEV
jgi:hypothetical protein